MTNKSLYWICQLTGWLFYSLSPAFALDLGDALMAYVFVDMFLIFFLGVIYSHLYRNIIIKLDWLRMPPRKQFPRVILATIIVASILQLTRLMCERFLFSEDIFQKFDLAINARNLLSFVFVFLFWSLFYFLIHFVENYRKAEIENLRWEKSINEIELNKLKSQLNPHFIFNSMNTIRALIDYEPIKAKEAVTQLANILRNALLMDKHKVISFDEEMNIVKDYLNLEVTRYEERLQISLLIHPNSNEFNVPPLMLQTLVENAIKHGISKLPKGGMLSIETKIDEPDKLCIIIKNSGHYTDSHNSSGFGLKNTQQRLQLLYGNAASFSIKNLTDNLTGTVLTELILPKTVKLQ